jgi:hypothetical protein
MPYRVDRLIALLLSMLLVLASGPVGAVTQPGPAIGESCGDCCAYAPDGERCATVSVCAPASTAQLVDDETPAKPLGAWSAGVVRAAYMPAATESWAILPASVSIGPPNYLSFGRFLL